MIIMHKKQLIAQIIEQLLEEGISIDELNEQYEKHEDRRHGYCYRQQSLIDEQLENIDFNTRLTAIGKQFNLDIKLTDIQTIVNF